MAFVRIEKSQVGKFASMIPGDSLTIMNSGMRLGDGVAKKLLAVSEYCEVLVDKEQGMLALTSGNELTGYKIQIDTTAKVPRYHVQMRKHGVINLGLFKTTLINGMLVVNGVKFK